LKNIAFIYSGDEKELSSLKDDREEVERILRTYGDWDEIICEELKTISDFQTALNQFKNDEIGNLFFYFTGHGQRLGGNEKALFLEVSCESPRNMNEFTRLIFDTLATRVKRLAVVLDTCFSGTYVYNSEIISGSFEILTSSDNQKKSSASSVSNMSRFTHYFCKSLEKLHKQSKPITLQLIHEALEEDLKPQKSIPSSPILSNGNMCIVQSTSDSLKENIKKELKEYFLAKNIEFSELENYTKRLLSFGFSSIRIPSEFDSLIDYLFQYRKEILIIILNQLNDNKLDVFIDNLLDLLRKNREDISSFAVTGIDMFKERSNLLIELKSNGKDGLSAVEVKISEYKQDKIETKVTPFIVDLTKDLGKVKLIDTIQDTVYLSRKNVLLEFILPFELMEKDISLWIGSDGRSLTPKLVKRLSLRIEMIRVRSDIKKEWVDVWDSYTNKGEECLAKVMTDEIDFEELEDKPYVRLSESLSYESYRLLVDESACIVLAPLHNDKRQAVDTVCLQLQNTELKNLLKESSKKFKKEKVPYLLIWDNPNRIPLKKSETKKSAVGR